MLKQVQNAVLSTKSTIWFTIGNNSKKTLKSVKHAAKFLKTHKSAVICTKIQNIRLSQFFIYIRKSQIFFRKNVFALLLRFENKTR